jgi:nucleoside-diphosphate-sugar epimerase
MKVGILGSNGFIGSELAKQFPGFSRYPRKDLDILFHFASPSSEVLFNEDIDYCFSETINSFLGIVRFCRDNKIKLIYPSSGTIYNKVTKYARCKACLEEIHQAYGGDILGLRIFAGYGPGEGHKGEYASVIYQWCKLMKQDKRPLVYGDGFQTRDFIYIDDIISAIMANLGKTGFMDIGSGINISFNKIIKTIRREFGNGVNPEYIQKPESYILETPCKNPVSIKVSVEEGIRRICQIV